MTPRLARALLVAALAGCAGPTVPEWQLNAHHGLERATDAYLSGRTRVATAGFERALGEVARSGRVDLAARVELTRCAAQVASLQFGPCAGFERLRADAPAAERAYAAYLEGAPLDAVGVDLLPQAQRSAAAAAGGGAERDLALLQGIDEPLSRLVAAAVWLRSGRASPGVMNLAAETASAQGWRRPLLAWLGVLKQRAEGAGDRAEAERIARRIALVTGAPMAP